MNYLHFSKSCPKRDSWTKFSYHGVSFVLFAKFYVKLKIHSWSLGHKDTGVKGAEKADPPKTTDEIKSIPPSEVPAFADNFPNEDHHQ